MKLDEKRFGELLYVVEKLNITRWFILFLSLFGSIFLIIMTIRFIPVLMDANYFDPELGKGLNCFIIFLIIITILSVLLILYLGIGSFHPPYLLLLFEKGIVVNRRFSGKFFSAPTSRKFIFWILQKRFSDYYIPINRIKEIYSIRHPLSNDDDDKYGDIVFIESNGKWHMVIIPYTPSLEGLIENLKIAYGKRFDKVYTGQYPKKEKKLDDIIQDTRNIKIR